MICARRFGLHRGWGRKHCVRNRLRRNRLTWLAAVGIAISVGCSRLPAFAQGPLDGGRRTQSFDELLNSKSTTNQLDRWHSHSDGTYGAQQIVGDAHLAQQLTDDAGPSGSSLVEKATGGTKEHRLPAFVVVLLAVGGLLVLIAGAILVWSRVVRRREMLDVPSPMAFNYPRI